jgi:FkbM family methyltransferase
MLEKLKTAFRVFFPKKLSPREVFENELINNSLKAELMDNGNSFKVSINDNCRVIVRNWKHSDLLVFKQVFLNDEYKNVLDLFDLNNLGNTNKRIIDAGANVGYSTVLFDRFFRNSTIACIEPSPSNFDVLKSNVSGCKNSIILYNNALTGQAGLTFSIQKDFRDGLDWAHSTVQDKHGEIKGKTILEIVNENNFDN